MRPSAQPPPVYAIADADALAPLSPAEAAQTIAEAGIRWIQLRLKSLSDKALYACVEDAVRRLEGSEAALWIDDRADIGALFDIRGVHLGQEDLPPRAARRLLSPSVLLGMSTHDLGQLRQADADPAVDVLAYGPVFRTSSKAKPDPVVGLEGLREACRIARKPVVAIGGIDDSTVAQVLEAGANSAAVIGAVARGGDIEANCRRLLEAAGRGRSG